MPHTHITLPLRIKSLRLPASLFHEERVPIDFDIRKLIAYFEEALPHEVRLAFRQQSTVFLGRVCEAGNEAEFMREYLGDLVTEDYDLNDLPGVLSALMHKEVPTPPMGNLSDEDVLRWTEEVVAALNEPYITKLLLEGFLSGRGETDIPLTPRAVCRRVDL